MSPGLFSFLSATNIIKLERLHRAASCTITSCLSSSPIPLLSEASLSPLQVTLTRFTLSSYERALRLPTSLSHFRFGQTCSETKTLQIALESFCIHSPVHASFYFFWGGSSCLPSLSSLESAFVHHGVHPFLLMLSL